MPDRTADVEPEKKETELSGERGDVDRAQKDEIVIHSGANSLGKQDHYHSVLARMVSSVSEDHGQLRGLVYEFARRKLRKDLVRQFEDGDWSEIEHQIATLEGAIDQLETDFSDGVPRLPFSGNGEIKGKPGVSVVTAEPLPPLSQRTVFSNSFGRLGSHNYDRQPPIVNVTDYAAKTRVERHLRSNFWRTTELIVAVTLGLAIYSAFDRQTALNIYNTVRYGRSASTTTTASLPQSAPRVSQEKDASRIETPQSRPGVSGFPLPTSYGVYALADGKLTTLDLLPIKPPDPRIAISAVINTPSEAHLEAGPIQFVVFRRDFANDAPDRVQVRVVAQIMRALTFDATGKASYSKVEPSWVIRNQSFQMSVAPAAGSPEMVVIRPDTPDFRLAPGRYALVLKKDAYDFTIDGPVSDVHCLERTDAIGGGVYSECPKPQAKQTPPATSNSSAKSSEKK